MDLGFDLNLEQRQTLIMTPQLQMAIELLQFSSPELEEYIQEELKANPLLERLENQYEEGLEKTNNQEDREPDYENYITYKPNLLEYLEGQFYQVLKDKEISIGRYIIGNLDQHGFLTLSREEICANLKIEEKKLIEILIRIQHLDPVGIAAFDVKESLLIQLESLILNTDLAREIVKNYWQEFTEKDYRKIIRKIDQDEEKVIGAINLIKTLNPYPAAGFSQNNDQVKYIIPDLVVKKVKGDFVIISNEKSSPLLKISPYYYRMLQENRGSEAYEFLQQKYRSALWLIRSIEQRRITIYRIAEAIVKSQKEFFLKGVKYLTPMTMQDIADIIGMHESTISRATTGKYLQTPHGLFELKFFFNRGANNFSSVSIKAIIDEYIQKEDPSSPLSDQEIAHLLMKRGIEISRRTVAKYRNELGIPSSTGRKVSK
jgi:RNA polymerase sigma-54 factor